MIWSGCGAVRIEEGGPTLIVVRDIHDLPFEFLRRRRIRYTSRSARRSCSSHFCQEGRRGSWHGEIGMGYERDEKVESQVWKFQKLARYSSPVVSVVLHCLDHMDTSL